MAGTSTRSPTPNPVTASPTSVTVPTASWPRMRPSVTAATSPGGVWGSVPQIGVGSTRTTTSVGSVMAASGTSSQALRPGPWYTRAFIGPTLVTTVTPRCPNMGLSAYRAWIAGRQAVQRDRDRALAAGGDDGLTCAEVGHQGAQGGQLFAVGR